MLGPHKGARGRNGGGVGSIFVNKSGRWQVGLGVWVQSQRPRVPPPQRAPQLVHWGGYTEDWYTTGLRLGGVLRTHLPLLSPRPHTERSSPFPWSGNTPRPTGKREAQGWQGSCLPTSLHVRRHQDEPGSHGSHSQRWAGGEAWGRHSMFGSKAALCPQLTFLMMRLVWAGSSPFRRETLARTSEVSTCRRQ